MSETLIKVENVSKKFCRDLKRGLWYGVQDIGNEILGRRKYNTRLRDKEFWAVRDVSFEVKRGQCLGLIGHNGAGKSTLLKMLNGLIKPDYGRIEMMGRIVALIELGAGFNPVLTGLENIYINGSILGLPKFEIESRLEAIIEFAEIGDFINTPVQYYSSGMKVRLGFAIAAQMEPDVLIIDEVLAVGDAAFRVKCYNKIFEILPNTAVIFVSHNMPQISRICSDVLLLHQGKIHYYGANIGIGMGEYFTMQNIKTTTTVQGSGKAEISNLCLLDSNNRAVIEIKYLQPLTISMNYSIRQEVPSFSFLIVIRNEEQTPVVQINSNEIKYETEFKSNRKCIKTTIPKVEFNPGKYSMTVSIIQGINGDLLCVYRDIAAFIVIGEGIGYAPVLLDLNWN